MLLRIMLWAMLIGSLVMGYLGIQSGSATNTIAGIVILLIIGFSIYFLFKLLFRFGFWAVKGIMIILLISAIIIIGIRGCQFLFAKGKAVSQTAIEKTVDLGSELKNESIWSKVTSLFEFKKNKDTTIASPSINTETENVKMVPALPETISGEVTEIRSGYLFKIDHHFIKLYGIDAPDPIQNCRDKRNQVYDCGHESKQNLERLILGKTVLCQIAGGDYRENYIAACSIQGVDIGVAMVSIGWAVADRRATNVYIPYEDEARNKHAGLWSGKFVAPWQDRAKRAKKRAVTPTSKKGFFDEWF